MTAGLLSFGNGGSGVFLLDQVGEPHIPKYSSTTISAQKDLLIGGGVLRTWFDIDQNCLVSRLLSVLCIIWLRCVVHEHALCAVC